MQYIIIGAVVVFFMLLFSTVRIVDEYKRVVILRLGKYQGTRGPGIVIVLPFLESATVVDLREKLIDIPAQTAITKDNASILIDFLVYFRITEPMLSVLKVDDVIYASKNIATTTLRAVIGDIELDGVLSKREQINDILRVKLDEATERWGLKVTAVEIREIEPPRDILDAMNRQMSAERDRRAEVTRAQGERESAIARAEGHKQAAILKAQGERESAVLEAQGQKEAQELKAMGYAKALEAISQTASTLDERTMALQYMEMLEKVGSSPSSKFILPMELIGFVNQFTQVTGLGAKERPRISGD
jgi:regulator of protease activity HflC (stomatin/prohibitin superfamily)